MPSIEVPQGYPYVLAAATSSILLNVYQVYNVTKARKAASIGYPQAYAEKAEAMASVAAYRFNCAQRAHQNTLESTPHVILSILVTGLKYPYLAAALGGTWIVGRFLYTIGYSTGDPDKRNKRGGFLGGVGFLGLVVSTGYTVSQFIKEGL